MTNSDWLKTIWIKLWFDWFTRWFHHSSALIWWFLSWQWFWNNSVKCLCCRVWYLGGKRWCNCFPSQYFCNCPGKKLPILKIDLRLPKVDTQAFFLSFLGVENQMIHLGPKRLSQIIARLLIITVGKNNLPYLWSGLHPRADQLQLTNVLNFHGTLRPVGMVPPL